MAHLQTKYNKPSKTAKGGKPALLDVLSFVESQHSAHADATSTSKTLLKLGVKDGVAQYWEGVIENPITSLYETSQKVEEVVTKFANEIVKSYLSKNNLVTNAYRSENSTHELHYCIVLKNDTLENRTKVNRFFSSYFDFNFSQKYPIHFQFVPAELVGKLKLREQIL